ncbi:MAG: hypothetical protein FWC47_05555 [Oscillospiraceae bacterium]|nr:hypothetical protein [Oscillospiraceae bacterium]
MTIDIIGWIILTILAIDGIRDTIARVGWFPLNSGRISNFIYGRSDEKIIEKALISLGYEKSEATKIKYGMTKSRINELHQMTAKICYRKLIQIIKKCLIKTPSMRYGSSTTNYYIHTMMGSQNQDILKDMSELLIHQILQDYSDSLPDFVIVPKSGNPLLGRYVASQLRAQCILYKDPNEKSYANNPDADLGNSNPGLDFQINFEGAYYLDEKKPLKGIVIDCNVSGGTQLYNATKAFNAIIEQMALPYQKIQNIYTLFRVDDAHMNIDTFFEQNGNLKLHRIFDLTEQIKEEIANLSDDDIDIYVPSCPKVDTIIDFMRNNNLLRLSTN